LDGKAVKSSIHYTAAAMIANLVEKTCRHLFMYFTLSTLFIELLFIYHPDNFWYFSKHGSIHSSI